MAKKRLARSTTSNKPLPPNVFIKQRKLADGTTEQLWVVRKRVTVKGKQKSIERACKYGSMTDYKDKVKEIDFEINGKTEEEIEHRDRTFGELADYFEQKHLVLARFSNGFKTNKGRRQLTNPLYYLNGSPRSNPNLGWPTLLNERTRLCDITGRMLADIKDDLFNKYLVNAGGKRPRARSFTDVNHRFKLLRKMFTVARVDLGWMSSDPRKIPFLQSTEPLIESCKEKVRNRIMSFEEEAALLRECIDGREHLRLIIVGLVDTCMRSSEFFKLTVGDWHERERQIVVQQWTTKTHKERIVPISARFRELLSDWIRTNNLKDDDWLFSRSTVRVKDVRPRPGMEEPIQDCAQAWQTVRHKAGVRGLTLKDLRRTGATRLLRAGYPLAEISQILGHSDITMTMVYLAVDKVTTDRACEVLDAMHAQQAALLAAQDATLTVN